MKIKITVLIGILVIFAALLILLSSSNTDNQELKNSELTSSELIRYLENNNYDIRYDNTDYTVENISVKFNSVTVTNNTITIFSSIDEKDKSTMFQDNSLNDEYHYIKVNDASSVTTEQKHQETAYKQWLKNNGISETQILQLLDYCFQNKYQTK